MKVSSLKRKQKVFSALKTLDINVFSTFNNVIVSASSQGKVIAAASGGSVGLKGSKKSTPYAGTLAVLKVFEKIQKICPNVNTVRVITKGPGASKESAIRTIYSYIKKILYIQDVTPIPHNGCTPPRPRSV